MTVGLHKTAAKRLKILGGRASPTALGRKGRSCVVDHHHLARALLDEGEKTRARPLSLQERETTAKRS